MNILIIGGVAAGMSCAARLRRLDENATVTVLEKGDDISIASCGLPYYVGGEISDERSLRVQTPTSISASLNLDIRVRHEALSIDPAARTVLVAHDGAEETMSYDALVLAPGARGVKLPIPGANLPAVHSLRTIEDSVRVKEKASQGGHAVVIGAGFIGLEAAENLRLAGMGVTLVEGGDHVLPPIDEEMSTLVLDELSKLGIDVIESGRVTAFDEVDGQSRVVVEGRDPIPADLILVAVGAGARGELAEGAGLTMDRGAIVVDEFGRTSDPRIWAAGDAVVSTSATTGVRRPVQLAGPGSRLGRRVADHVMSVLHEGEVGYPAPRPFADPLGTAIVRVGSLGVAMAGASARELDREGIAFETVRVHHAQHVGYIPGASTITLLIHYGQDRRILGAQAIGREGADRRIDVLATAIRGDLTVDELVDVDLAYSPVYGAPKDVVNMAAMVAENRANGMLVECDPAAVPELSGTHLVLDARRVDEVEVGPRIPGALNIPHTQLRGLLEEVREAAAGRPILVLCRSGVRSYRAYRMLKANGFDVIALSGGMLALQAWARRHPGIIEI